MFVQDSSKGLKQNLSPVFGRHAVLKKGEPKENLSDKMTRGKKKAILAHQQPSGPRSLKMPFVMTRKMCERKITMNL